MTLTLIIVLALMVVLALAVGVLAIVNRRMRRKHKREREELERQYLVVDELLETEAWKLDELWTSSQRLENELEALVRMLDEQDSRSESHWGLGKNYGNFMGEAAEEIAKKIAEIDTDRNACASCAKATSENEEDEKEKRKRRTKYYTIAEDDLEERLLNEGESNFCLVEKQPTTDIYELRKLREMLAHFKQLNEEGIELSYNALRELKRIRREIDRISKRTEKAREDRKKEK